MRLVVDGLPYPVVVAADGSTAAHAVGGRRVFIAYDAAVRHRAEIVVAALRAAAAVIGELAMTTGERHKRWPAVARIHDELLAAGAGRDVVLVAVGGGTLTDVAGFAAATFMRGIAWLPVATSLVGMADAAIGGKTGVNLPQGKNLVGAFWDPIYVVADTGALATLPLRALQEGMAEIVKAAIVGDSALLDALERTPIGGDPKYLAQLVVAAAAVKARAVADDPRDTGTRAALNLGHTFGHAVELASRHRIRHGAAVALGLRAAGIAARDRTGFTHADHLRVVNVLKHAGLRVRMNGLAPDDVVNAMAFDKKRDGEGLKFVLPVRIGEVRTGVELNREQVDDILMELTHMPGRRAW